MAKRREHKLSQLLRESLQTAPSVYYKKLNRWLLIPGRLSDDHRPLYTSHLTALLVTSVLRWIMQEMLWRIRHSGAEESCCSVWTCFHMKSETHLDASFAGKDKKISGKNQKKKKKSVWWTLVSLVFLCTQVFVSCLNLQRIYLVIRKESSKRWMCKSVSCSVFVSFDHPCLPFPPGSPLAFGAPGFPRGGDEVLGAGVCWGWEPLRRDEGWWGAPHTQTDQNLPSNLSFCFHFTAI